MSNNGQRYGIRMPLERLSDKLDTDDESDSDCGGVQGADFETAISATGYGKFNYLLLAVLFLPCWASIFDVSNMSMILPSAECDLELSLFHKGVLNAVTYAAITVATAPTVYPRPANLWKFHFDGSNYYNDIASAVIIIGDGSFGPSVINGTRARSKNVKSCRQEFLISTPLPYVIFFGVLISPGSITTAIFWGFASDIYGRKKLLIYGFMADSLCNLLSGFAQSFWVLLFFKFASGCIMNGPYAIMMSFVAEFNGGQNRARSMLFMGLFSTIGNIAIPVLAWSVIPGTWKIVLFDGRFVYNSWRLFLSLCGLPTMIGFIALIFFPESPKFLMSQGRNDEALQIFRHMYAMNTGKPANLYPVVSLEKGEKSYNLGKGRLSTGGELLVGFGSFMQGLKDGLKQMKPLFMMPNLLRLLLVVGIQFGGMLALNTIRLWLPQLFTLIENLNRSGYNNTLESPTFCEMLDMSMKLTRNTSDSSATKLGAGVTRHCENMLVDKTVYINIIIICVVSVIGFIFMSTIVNIIGKKNILLICYGLPLVCAASLNWSANTILTLFLACSFVALANISVNALIAVTVDLFPTTLRTMAVSLIMMMGRSGSLVGNLLFAVLLVYGCIAPLMAIAGILLVCVLLTLFIPTPSGGVK